MKEVCAFIILMISIASTVAAVNVFIIAHEGVKSLNGSEHLKSDPSVIGHRVTSQGQFVLVYK